MPRKKRSKKKIKLTADMILIGCIALALLSLYFYNLKVNTAQQLLMVKASEQNPLLNLDDPHMFADIYSVIIHFTITDANNGNPVSSVHVTVTITYAGIDMTDEAYTDSNGQAKIDTFQCDNTRIKLEHPNYQTLEDTQNTGSSQARYDLYLNYQLTPNSSPPPNQVMVKLYVQVDTVDKFIVGDVTFDSESYGITRNNAHQHYVDMWLTANTAYTMNVAGHYADWNDLLHRIPYSYTIHLTTTNSNAVYWLDLATGNLYSGEPPTPPPDPIQWLWDLLAWLGRYWEFIIVGGIVLYALPYVATLAKLFER